MLKEQFIGNKYKIIKTLKQGATSQICVVQKIPSYQNTSISEQDKKYIAKIQKKVEKVKLNNGKVRYQNISKKKLLFQEQFQILDDIQRTIDKNGFPKVYEFFQYKHCQVLITDIRSLKLYVMIKNFHNKHTTIQMFRLTLKIGYDLLDRIQSIHQAKYIHRNIRPELINFKRDKNKDILIINDYSAVLKYNEYDYQKKVYHIQYQINQKSSGKTGFSSIYTHCDISKSRRDDIQSFCYVLIYFFLGNQLPWSDVDFQNNELQQRKAFEMKLGLLNTNLFEQSQQQQQNIWKKIKSFIGEGFMGKQKQIQKAKDKEQETKLKIPKQIKDILLHARRLQFQQQPDYIFIRKCLKKAMNRYEVTQTEQYDWDINFQKMYPYGI